MAYRVSKRTWENAALAPGRKKSSGRKAGESWKAEWKLKGGKWTSKSGFRTQEEAIQHARKMEAEVEGRTADLKGQTMTVRELVNLFEEELRLRVSRDFITGRHLINEMGHLRNYLLGEEAPRATWRGARPIKLERYFADWTLQDVVTTDNVATDHTKAILNTSLSTGSVKGALSTIGRCFEFAKERKWIKENPFGTVKVETPRGERNKRRYPPSQASLAKVISLSSDPFTLILELVACTGLREGELRAVRRRDVDLKNRQLTIKHAVGEGNKIGEPKSAAGVRDIPISTRLAERLRIYMTAARFDRPNDLLFPDENGCVLPEGVGLDGIDRLIKGLGWPHQKGEAGPDELQRFTFHSVRHYAICAWIASGLGIKAVQTFAGHSSIEMTWDRYGWLFPSEEHWVKIEIASELVYGEQPAPPQRVDKKLPKAKRSLLLKDGKR